MFTAPAETVIVRVGETEITVGDYRKRLAFETSIYRLRMMNTKQKVKDIEKKVWKFEELRYQTVLPLLVRQELLGRYLDAACGGSGLEGEDEIVRREARRLGGRLGQKGAKLEKLAGEIGVEPAYLKAHLLASAREAKARACFDPASTNVTEKEIDAGLARLDAYTARAVASNKTTRATCAKTLARVRQPGADFVAIAKTCGADDPREAVEWGWFNREDFDMMAKGCPAFKRWAFAAKTGDIGGPFDIDDGLSIVKVVGHQAGTAVVSAASKQAEEVQLVRINFAMAEEQPEPRTREHCRKALLEWKTRDVRARLFGKLFDDAKIEYPNGDKLDFTGKEK